MPSRFRSRGRGGFSSRGRGRWRGGARGSIRPFGSRPKKASNEPPPDDPENSLNEREESPEHSDSESNSEEEEEHSLAKLKPYQVLLESLVASKAKSENRKSKRRKIAHHETEELVIEGVGLDVDTVDEEAEGEGEVEVMGEGEGEGEDDNPLDPFETHFTKPSPEFLKSISMASKRDWQTTKLVIPEIGRAVHSFPKDSKLLSGGGKFDKMQDLQLKQRLRSSFDQCIGELSSIQRALSSYVFSYQDVLFTGRTVQNADQLRKLYCLHILNHVFKTRDRVVKNNSRISHSGEDLEYRDQGFTRPKILIMLPTRNSCVQVVDTLISLSAAEQQENKKRFTDAYSMPADQERLNETKPEDFKALFSGNHDDLFRVGIKFTRKTIKFFSQFYNSDIIVASPLGLRLAIGDEGDKKKRDFDFLSSIEMVVVDQSDALLMQNWDHVDHVFKHLNLIPKDAHGCDFSRVRNWYLDGNARYLRQTIVLGAYGTPELNALFNQHMSNVQGRIKTQSEYPGVITDLHGLQVHQTFTKFDASTPSTDPDARFDFFKAAILPIILRTAVSTSRNQESNNLSNSISNGILIFIASFFDFIRLRNHLSTTNISFGAISEETSVSDVSRARSHFLSGRYPVLLYTGRAHHFRRYELRGVKQVFMYSLPENQIFYTEIVARFLLRSICDGLILVDSKRPPKVRCLFSKWDRMKLERIVGSGRVPVMCNDADDTFEFV